MKDDAGKVKVKLHMHHGGPRLSLYDASGMETVILMQGVGGGRLYASRLYHIVGTIDPFSNSSRQIQ
jgi:hypothetical protein